MKIIRYVENIKHYYKNHKILLYSMLAAIIILSIGLQFYLFYNEKMHDSDLRFDAINWTWTCNNKIYTQADKDDFCNKCVNDKEFSCTWPVDMNISFDNVVSVRKTGAEVHCFFIIDGINMYAENGRYFGLTNDTLFTWQVLQADTNHSIEFCCGIDRTSPITTTFGLEKEWKQACLKQDVAPRCGVEYKLASAERLDAANVTLPNANGTLTN